MVHLFNGNESLLNFYEKFRNEFVYRALLYMEYFESSYQDQKKKNEEKVAFFFHPDDV